jgi:hypothetical protein
LVLLTGPARRWSRLESNGGGGPQRVGDPKRARVVVELDASSDEQVAFDRRYRFEHGHALW